MANQINDEETKTYSKEEVDNLLNKVRSDQKTQLYPKVEEAQNRADKAEKSLEEFKVKFEAVTADLEAIKKEKEQLVKKEEDTELNKNEAKLAEKLRQNTETLENKLIEMQKLLDQKEATFQEALNKVATDAAEKIMASELKAYRIKKTAEAKLHKSFERFVTGKTPEEIDLSIEEALKEQADFYKEIENEVAEKRKKEVPKPAAPNANESFVNMNSEISERQARVRTSDSEYEKQRAARVAKILAELQN